MSLGAVTHLLLDIDNTLVDRQRAIRRFVGDLLTEHLGRGFDEVFLARALALDDLGYASREQCCHGISCLLAEAGILRPPDGPRIWAQMLARLACAVEPREEITAAVGELGQRYDLAILSNGGGDHQRRKLRAASLDASFSPEHVFVSGDLHTAKPQAAAFAHVLETMGWAEERTLHVGDHPLHDVEGARRAGLQTCWISLGRDWPEASAPPDLVVDDLSHLPGALRLSRPSAPT